MYVKKSLTIAICLILISAVTALAQPDWIQQQTNVFGALNSIYFTGQETGYAAGNDGVILKTTNGGSDWSQLGSGTNGTILGISFGDENTGTACGYSGLIMRTTSAGDRWEIIQDGWMISYYSAFMLDAGYGYVAGVNSIFQPFISTTTNTWETMSNYNFYIQQGPNMFEGDLRDVVFLNGQHGFGAAKIFNGQGAIVETVNGGADWTTVQWSDNALLSIDFADNQNGIAVGQGAVCYKTDDGGLTWTLMNTGITDNMNSVCYVNADNAWACGDDGVIIHTADGGISWEIEIPNAFTTLNEVHFYDMDHGYIAGNNGVILKREAPQFIDATVTLYPDNPPIIIPSTGGEFNFVIEIINNGLTTVNLDVWTMVTFPNGMLYGPIIMANADFQPGVIVTRARSQGVPASAAPGTYYYTAFIGDYPFGDINDDFFLVEKLGDDAVSGNDEWYSWGESFEDISSSETASQPEKTTILSAYPNPFNPATTLSYVLPEAGHVTLSIYDVNGREAAKLAEGFVPAGEHSMTFDGGGLPSGMYFARLEAGDFTQTQKLLLVK